jgi:acetyl-CoA synthetase
MAKPNKWVVKNGKKRFLPSNEMKKRAWINKKSIYREAAKNPIKFWAKLAKEGIDWYKKWKKTYEWKPPHFKWFIGGKLNASYNALDRHIKTWKKNKAAIIWEPENIDEGNRVLTYYDLWREVNKLANVLKSFGVKKGDRVSIYLPMIPEVQIAMLACARIGAPHSVVFSAFSAESLNYRMAEAEAEVLITADGYSRKGKFLNLKEKADEAAKNTKIKHVIVVKRAGIDINWVEGRDHWWHDLVRNADDYCEPEGMDSEDLLFILYTSGTTGKPKGIMHTTGGYLTQAYWTAKWDFNLHDDDFFWCTADIGWITGHTYNCYGPLMNGATILIYEGALNWPDHCRWCEIINKYGVTIFYTAPTAIRMFIESDGKCTKRYDLSSLRILGTVGEPIDYDAWIWFFEEVGGGRCPVIDTWWQTETGGTLINSLPGIGPFIPTVAGRSFPGIKHEILDDKGKKLPLGKVGNLVLLSPFGPGMLRGVYKNPERYVKTYWSQYGNKIYFTSDGAWKDKNGNVRLTGRIDDVMKVAGHRLATAELEDAINRHKSVTECAVIGAPHEIKGEVPYAFVIVMGVEPSDELAKELVGEVEKAIGPIARPHKIMFVEDLPKTRSGKIMRRILKRLLTDQPLGDITTLANPESIKKLKKIVDYKGLG